MLITNSMRKNKSLLFAFTFRNGFRESKKERPARGKERNTGFKYRSSAGFPVRPDWAVNSRMLASGLTKAEEPFLKSACTPHFHQSLHALLGSRVGRKKTHQALAAKRVYRKHV